MNVKRLGKKIKEELKVQALRAVIEKKLKWARHVIKMDGEKQVNKVWGLGNLEEIIKEDPELLE